jgi:hypothetical protein
MRNTPPNPGNKNRKKRYALDAPRVAKPDVHFVYPFEQGHACGTGTGVCSMDIKALTCSTCKRKAKDYYAGMV